MARPIWKGHISFGLVYIPISLYSAEQKSRLSFHLLDKKDLSRVRYERVNENTGKEVPWDQTVRAYEYEKGQYVVLDEEDFKKVEIESSQTINIENFVNADEVPHLYFEKPYYLVPEGKGEKGYVLLREALKRTKKIGIAKVVIRSRQYLAAVLPSENALILDLMRFSDEVRQADEFEMPTESMHAYKISSNEMKIAEQLIAAMTTQWKPDEYRDDYREELLKFIEEKEAGIPHERKARVSRKAKVVDFMELMKKSIAAKKPLKKPRRAKKKTVKKAAA